jgi:flagellar protein FlgJ
MLAAGITANDTLAVDVGGAQALKAKAAAGDKGALRAAAQQFESLMIGMMLKSMRATKFSEDDDPMTSGEGVKLYRDLLDQQWADKLAKGHGLGFADMIVKSMEKFSPPQSAPPSPSGGGAGGEGTTPTQAPASNNPRSLSPTPPALQPATAARSSPLPPGEGLGVRGGEGLKKKRAFLDSLRPQAEAAAAATGVPADFILAHAALESGWGARTITGADGSNSYNLFGVKAGSNWQGDSVQVQTTEYRQGVPLKVAQTFRAYADYGAAFNDYASLLKSRYAQALQGNDANGFAQGLAAGGYASDPAYAGKLQSVIASVAMANG